MQLCELQRLSIGGIEHFYPRPFKTSKISEERLTLLIRENFDLRPYGILKMLDLIRPIYTPTAAYGHFGRDDLDLSWERTDKAELLRGSAAA